MNKKNLVLSAAFGLLVSGSTFALQRHAALGDTDPCCVTYIEEEEVVNLGFDTADYLPENFDPAKFYVDLNAIAYLEEECIELGVETSAYLPENFDAYAAPQGIDGITYIDENDTIVSDFDASEHLPEGFDPYEFYLDLNSIEYIEEEEIELDFNVNEHLPMGFDPTAK
ncbi:hypothetical protein WIW50_09470 [Flavobacteriaceae bacterium 3-367]|uniref:hypothetical protein n=1 Tax=Eudoraea algarum TaxID=3417568 RepID=UPI003295B689